jgi:hypothetical protein
MLGLFGGRLTVSCHPRQLEQAQHAGVGGGRGPDHGTACLGGALGHLLRLSHWRQNGGLHTISMAAMIHYRCTSSEVQCLIARTAA